MRTVLTLTLLLAPSLVAAPSPADRERERREAEAAFKSRLEAAERQKVDAHAMFEKGQTLEREGRNTEAVDTYRRAARMGNPEAARRLSEIYGIETREPGYLRREPYRGAPPGGALNKTR